MDSVHAGMLHQTWIALSVSMAEHSNLELALAESPTYETEATPYGLRAAALRRRRPVRRTCASPSTWCRS